MVCSHLFRRLFLLLLPHILTCPPVVTCQGYQGNGSCSDLPAGWEAQPGGIFTGNKVITFTFLHYAAATFTPDHGICFYYQKDSDSPSGYFDVGSERVNPLLWISIRLLNNGTINIQIARARPLLSSAPLEERSAPLILNKLTLHGPLLNHLGSIWGQV